MLRLKAKRVTKIDDSIHRLIADMVDSMREANGVGVAAPQIGVSLRVVVIGLPGEEPFAFINPQVLKRSGQRRVDEGCLSVPGYRGEVSRSLTVIVRALDPAGRQVRIKASAKSEDDNQALLAQALEHETDHIDGVLYIDHLKSMDELVKIDPPDTGPSGQEPALPARPGSQVEGPEEVGERR